MLGTRSSFNPEAFGRLTRYRAPSRARSSGCLVVDIAFLCSRGIAVIFCEVLLLKGGFYLLSDSPSPPLLVLAAWRHACLSSRFVFVFTHLFVSVVAVVTSFSAHV